jgi:hypothetical protein
LTQSAQTITNMNVLRHSSGTAEEIDVSYASELASPPGICQ